MSREVAQDFIEALHRLERDGDVDGLVELFSDDCSIANVVTQRVFHGQRGARDFWREYRSYFSELESEFKNVVSSGDRVALEWVSHGSNLRGAPVNYEGVSMLEIEDGKIVRFHAYFDPQVLSEQLAPPTPY